MQLQKEVTKQPSCKNMFGPQEGCCEKDMKSKVAVRMVARLIAKLLITTIQMNLMWNPSEMWRSITNLYT